MSFEKNKKIARIIFAFALTLFFAGCTNPVFYSIRKEVALEEATIKGFVNSIVRFTDSSGKEWLYLQNGRIYYKQVSEDGTPSALTKNMANKSWTHDDTAPEKLHYDYMNGKFDGWVIYKLASDSNSVYALAYKPVYNDTYSRNVPGDIKLFCSSGINSGWKEVTSINEAIKDYISRLNPKLFMKDSSIHLFCTNSPKNAHREAFIRIGGGMPSVSSNSADEMYEIPNQEKNYGNITYGNYGIIKLNGEYSNKSGSMVPATQNGASYKTLSAYYANGAVHFMDFIAVGTNETKNDEATYVYYGNAKKLMNFKVSDFASSPSVAAFKKDTNGNYVSSGANLNQFDAYINSIAINSNGDKAAEPSGISSSSGPNASIISLAVTKDSILLGTYEYGAYRLLKDSSGKPAASTVAFETNADSIMHSPYIVRMLFCTDPTIGETEAGSALYSSMQFRYTESSAGTDYKNVGLWSYYQNRGNWNKE